jgi:hypothetical protein
LSLEAAIEEGQAARTAYYESIDLPDEQILGEPASAAALDAIEHKFGRPLAPSYRRFLELHDGWMMASGDLDLLSTAQMAEAPYAGRIKKFHADCEKYNDKVGARSLVIGYSETTPKRLLLDPERVDGAGEWTLVVHHHGEEETSESFLVWLEDSVEEFNELAEEDSEEIQ